MVPRSFRNSLKKVCAVGVKFEFELYDNFIGQFATTFFPHAVVTGFLQPLSRGHFRGEEWAGLDYTKHLVGVLSFLMRLERRAAYPGLVLHNTTLLHAASFS